MEEPKVGKRVVWRNAEAFIMRYIEEQGLNAGDKLPSDKDFSEQVDCSIHPIVRAMGELARKGIVKRHPGGATEVLSPRFGVVATDEASAGEPQVSGDEYVYSFSHGARHTYGRKVETRLLEQSRRLPLPGEAGRHFDEREVQKWLDLSRREPFHVIRRLRILDGIPRVIHVSYLNPARFETTFLSDHDFTSESLIHIYNEAGYRIASRDTTLRARYPTEREMAELKIPQEPILDAEQQMHAVHIGTGEQVKLEYLHACYTDHWAYTISDRRAAKGRNENVTQEGRSRSPSCNP